MKKFILEIPNNMISWIIQEKIKQKFSKKVKPKEGSIVYCDLALGYAEHSGIYIGNDKIVELSSSGKIQKVSIEEFKSGGLLTKTGISDVNIYVSSKNGSAVGSHKVARRAIAKVGKTIEYNVLTNNCHKFSCGCLTGDFDSFNVLLTALKIEVEKVLGANEWLIWDI